MARALYLRLKDRGSIPSRSASDDNPEQVVHTHTHTHTHVPLSSSSIIWYRSRDGDAMRLGR